MSNEVLTGTDLRTLTLRDVRAETTADERARLRGPERDRWASMLDRLEKETRERLTLLDAEYQTELKRRAGHMTDEQKRAFQQEYEGEVQALRRDQRGIYARLDELTAPTPPPVIRPRIAPALATLKEAIAPAPPQSEAPPAPDLTGWLTAKEAATAYGIGHSTVWDHIKRGKLRAVKVATKQGPEWRIAPPPTKTATPPPAPPPVSAPAGTAPEGWLTLAQASAAYGLSDFQLRDRLIDGRIKGVKVKTRGGALAWRVAPPPAQEAPAVVVAAAPEPNPVPAAPPDPTAKLLDAWADQSRLLTQVLAIWAQPQAVIRNLEPAELRTPGLAWGTLLPAALGAGAGGALLVLVLLLAGLVH